jgi:hypothetical protein
VTPKPDGTTAGGSTLVAIYGISAASRSLRQSASVGGVSKQAQRHPVIVHSTFGTAASAGQIVT